MPGESFDIVTGTSSYKLIYKGVCVCLCGADTAVSISFRLWMDLPLSSPRHLSITRSMDTLMTLIMWRGHMAWRSVCVCVCVWCMSTNACAGASAPRSWKQIALETRPSSWSPPLESHCLVMVTEEIWPPSWEGNRNGLFASASECHPRCPLLSGESRGMSNGRRWMLAMWGHRGVTGSVGAALRVHVNFSPFKY